MEFNLGIRIEFHLIWSQNSERTQYSNYSRIRVKFHLQVRIRSLRRVRVQCCFGIRAKVFLEICYNLSPWFYMKFHVGILNLCRISFPNPKIISFWNSCRFQPIFCIEFCLRNWLDLCSRIRVKYLVLVNVRKILVKEMCRILSQSSSQSVFFV